MSTKYTNEDIMFAMVSLKYDLLRAVAIQHKDWSMAVGLIREKAIALNEIVNKQGKTS